jgi:hypothetical protein
MKTLLDIADTIMDGAAWLKHRARMCADKQYRERVEEIAGNYGVETDEFFFYNRLPFSLWIEWKLKKFFGGDGYVENRF